MSKPNSMAMPAVSSMATKKPANESVTVCFHDDCNTSSVSEVPLSNKMTTSVTDTNTEPPTPKLSGLTQCSTGPSNRPMTISNNTSGMLRRV